jgi:hypothetical protein
MLFLAPYLEVKFVGQVVKAYTRKELNHADP